MSVIRLFLMVMVVSEASLLSSEKPLLRANSQAIVVVAKIAKKNLENEKRSPGLSNFVGAYNTPFPHSESMPHSGNDQGHNSKKREDNPARAYWADFPGIGYIS